MTEQQILTVIFQYGGFGVIACIFFYILRWNMKNYDCLKEQHEATVKQFAEVMTEVQTTMDNHIDHNTRALDNLCEAIKEMKRQ